MDVVIASEVLGEILRQAEGSPTEERCGLLLSTSGMMVMDGILPCANVAADPSRRFEIDPVALLAAHRAARSGGPAVVGHYHSHPSGDPVPSPRDAADAAADGALWLIVGGGEVRAWRAVSHGAVHNRFDPVTLRVVPAPATQAQL